MTVTGEFLEHGASDAASFEDPLPPARRVAVVARMDARRTPYGALGHPPAH